VRLGAIVAEAHPDNLAALASAGVTEVRLAVRWGELQPSEGRWSGGAVDALLESVTASRAAGLEPWLALLGRRTPPWFDDEGGFADPKTAGRWWPRYVEGVADRVGDGAAGWFPMVGPTGFAAQAFARIDPTRVWAARRSLMVAWRDAWRVLQGGPPVATALSLQPWDDEWTRALRTGEPAPNGLELDGLSQSCDLLGGIASVGPASSAEETGELLVRLAGDGPERPLAVLLVLEGTSDEERSSAAERAADAVRLTIADGVAVDVTFADGLLAADGSPSLASEVLASLASPESRPR
jgi:hypothetical protein